MKRWIRWRAFRNAPVRFHVSRENAYPEKIEARLNSAFQRWMRLLTSERMQRRHAVEMERLTVQSKLASASMRQRLLDAVGDAVRIHARPAGTVLVYSCKLRWSLFSKKRRIELKLAEIILPDGLLPPPSRR